MLASVTSLSAETLDRLRINLISDRARVVANAKFDPVTGSGTDLHPYIRGGVVT